MRGFPRGGLSICGYCGRIAIAGGIRLYRSMMVVMAAFMNLLRSEMNMDHSRNVIVICQTRGGSVRTRQRVGDRRRQHTKRVDQSDEPACRQSLCSGQAHQHLYVMTPDLVLRLVTIAAKAGLAKAPADDGLVPRPPETPGWSRCVGARIKGGRATSHTGDSGPPVRTSF